MVQVEIWVVVDENGDYTIGQDQEEAANAYAENINGNGAQRQFCLKLNVPEPQPVELEATLPEEPAVQPELSFE